MTAPAPAAPAASPAPAATPPAVATPPKVVQTALDPGPDPVSPAAVPAVDPAAPATPAVVAPPPDPAAADWRAKLSKGDEKVLKRLERYASEADVANALIHAQDRIAKGIKPTLDPKATPEEIKQFRELHGIPEKPEEYKVELANGRVIGDEDRPAVNAFLKDMHAAHAPPALVNAMLNSYYAQLDAAVEAREDRDIDQKVALTTELKEDYGLEYKENMRAVVGLLDGAPADLGKALHDARLPDGTALFNDARMVRWLVQIAKDLNPAATIVPGSAGNAAQTLSEKIAAFQELQKTRDLTAAENKEHLALIEAQQRMEAAGKGLQKAA